MAEQFVKRIGQTKAAKEKHTDHRLKIIGEVLANISAVKSDAYEIFFKDRVNGIRDKELDFLRKNILYKALIESLAAITSLFSVIGKRQLVK